MLREGGGGGVENGRYFKIKSMPLEYLFSWSHRPTHQNGWEKQVFGHIKSKFKVLLILEVEIGVNLNSWTPNVN